MKKGILIILCLISVQSFAQWKSYYPEKNKKQIEKETVEKDDFLFNNHLFTALKAKTLEDYEQALKYFQKCIKLNDKIPTPYYESAQINKDLGNYNLAIEQIRKAVNLEKENRWYILAYGEILFSNQDFKNAAFQYKKLLELEPGNEELYFMLSDTYIYDNDFKKAIAVYDDLEKHKGIDKMISMQKQKLYMQLHKKKEAIRELIALLAAYPQDIEAMEILSELYLLNNEKDKAFEIFKQIAILAPENGRIHLTLADYYRENGENDKSFFELKLAFQSSKLDIDTKIRILISYFQLININQQMSNQAYELSEILITTNKGDPKAHAVYADILYTDKHFQEAKEQYFIVLEQDKTKSEVWSQVLFIQAEQNDFKGMLNTSDEALTYFPTNPLFYYFNGVSNKWFKQYNEAILSLEMGIEFVLENEMLLLEFYSSLADSYHAIKQHDLSDSLYEQALEIDPENVMVLNNYAYYLSLRKINLAKAKQMSLKCNTIEKDNGTYQDTYAWVLYQLAEYVEAKEWMQKSLANGSATSAVVVDHYGDILYQLGEINEALIQWKKAKELGKASELLNQKIEEGKLYE
jgi:tetratricopeptide (TPR) repeat protein